MPGPGDLKIGRVTVAPGERADGELPVARLPTGTWLSLPVAALNGADDGPRLWINAALHGDEVNGIEIIRQVLTRLDPARLRGRVLAVPIVNVFGFIQQARYLPDRRDLNRSFPGSPRGSMASRLANLFMTHIVEGSQFGLDLHTGSHHRTNMPQIRVNLENPELRRMALAFGAPLVYHGKPIHGSLRWAAGRAGVPTLTYEAGEPLRFDGHAVEVGLEGVLRLLQALDMYDAKLPPAPPPFEAVSGRWMRASRGGIFRLEVGLGERVTRGQVLGRISDPLSSRERRVPAAFDGLVVGCSNNPLVHQGDALIHLARRSED